MEVGIPTLIPHSVKAVIHLLQLLFSLLSFTISHSESGTAWRMETFIFCLITGDHSAEKEKRKRIWWKHKIKEWSPLKVITMAMEKEGSCYLDSFQVDRILPFFVFLALSGIIMQNSLLNKGTQVDNKCRFKELEHFEPVPVEARKAATSLWLWTVQSQQFIFHPGRCRQSIIKKDIRFSK